MVLAVQCFMVFSPDCWLRLASCLTRLYTVVLCFGGWFVSFCLFSVAVCILCVFCASFLDTSNIFAGFTYKEKGLYGFTNIQIKEFKLSF